MPALTGPATTYLLAEQLQEAGDFTFTVEDPSLPAAIRNVIALAQQSEGTNEAPSILLTIDKIPGTSEAGSISKAIEVYGWHIGGRRKSVEGADGQLQATGHIVLEDLLVVCPDNAFVEASIQNTFDGANVGKVGLTFLRNIGPTAQPDFQINLTNCRITALYEGEVVTAIGFGFDTIEMTYFPVDDTAKASGKVAAGFDLTKNAAKK